MTELTAEHFPDFFEALHGKTPFPWQKTLAKEACAGSWPNVIDLPTASGKTACLDIALFALAANRHSPRRIFFVVDRRVIVNEAFDRMSKVAEALGKANEGILATVAGALRNLAGGEAARPLDVYQLRGGIYRDQSWVRSPLQPIIVTSTVDQVGSRLLFRGYGVSDSSAPIHAALIANDSLIFLDEAHCSRAFSQTLAAVTQYRSSAWAKTPLNKSFSFVEMTATPSQETTEPFRLTEADTHNEFLRPRLFTAKPTELKLIKARANDVQTLATNLSNQAIQMAQQHKAKRIAVMVNRVNTARRVFESLSKQIDAQNVHLLIGRMRPIDRDKLVSKLQPLKAGEERDPEARPTFVVSTQCLEVGADLDFDVLVTECASIDALLQRFGRLDRLGALQGNARGCILTLSGIAESKDPDLIYDHCLSQTWRWLNQLAGDSKTLNMGISSTEPAKPTVREALNELAESQVEQPEKLRRMGTPAPALLPSHLDALVQTSPRPHAEPEVALFLHGRDEGPAEIQVVWRKDLDGVPVEAWTQIVGLCPPVSAEAMPVRLDQFRRWMTGEKPYLIVDSDLEGTGEEDEPDIDQEPRVPQQALIWRGDESEIVRNPRQIKPNATVILSLAQQGWDQFGHIPPPAADIAEEAIFQSRARRVFRIHKNLWPELPPKQLENLIQDEEFNWSLWEELAQSHQSFFANFGFTSVNPADYMSPIPYPIREGEEPRGWVLQLKQRNLNNKPLDEDEGNDEKSHTDQFVRLDDHTREVAENAKIFGEQLVPDYAETLIAAAQLHDTGKTDARFQTMLHGGDKLAASFFPVPLAKSEKLTSGLYRVAKSKSGLPPGFRHELASLHIANKQPLSATGLEWILHLIASHHGYCRPFAPVVLDHNPGPLRWDGVEISPADRKTHPAHHLSSRVASRFWRFTREFGWWGSAYLETCLRLADWTASEGKWDAEAAK